MKRLAALGGAAAVAVATALTPITAHAAATPTGGGAHIVFVRNGNIFIANTGGTGLVELTKSGKDSQPVVSGNKIAFTRGGWIWTMTTAGKNLQRWFYGHGASFAPGDNTRIAYIGVQSDVDCTESAVFVQPLIPESTRTVVTDNWQGCPGQYHPTFTTYGYTTSWVPGDDEDATTVVFAEENDGIDSYCGCRWDDIEAATINPEVDPSDTVRQIAQLPYGDPPAIGATAQWSGAGTVAYAAKGPSGSMNVFSTPLGGGSAVQTSSDAGVKTPSFSPDGRYLIWTLPGKATSIRRLDRKTGAVATLIKNGGLSPSWG